MHPRNIIVTVAILCVVLTRANCWRRRRRRRCDTSPCQWNWGSCSKSCGGGMQAPVVTRGQGACGSCNLPGARKCNTQCCMQNCAWGSWSSWSLCSATCGRGIQSRSRIVSIQSHCGGSSCKGPKIYSRLCNTQCCPVNCIWGSWSEYGSCTETCGGGRQSRIRKVLLQSSCGGAPCLEPAINSRLCNTHCCPENCVWGSWSEYGSCTETCGGGRQSRIRKVLLQSSCGGAPCLEPAINSRSCNTHCCPENCVWGSWSEYGSCTETCGGGRRKRIRQVAVLPKCGGLACLGSAFDSKACNTQCCPVNCKWDYWSEYDTCTKSCDGGSQSRIRRVSVLPSCGGSSCSGSLFDFRKCNTHCCPINCVWDPWSKYTPCSAICGGGTQNRSRQVQVAPKCGGSLCTGSPFTSRTCNTHCCAVNCQWDEWSTWGSCSVSCGSGIAMRSRSVKTLNSCGGTSCLGPEKEQKICNEHCCPVNCVMTVWSPWSNCSAACGGLGVSRRTRSILILPSCDGIECPESNQTKNCNRFCYNGGVFDGLACSCKNGWSGTCCENDINECADKEIKCHENAICSNTEGNYTCSCMTGFSGDGFNCENMNECLLNVQTCHSNAACHDTPGSYQCVCKEGYYGNGINCTDKNECKNEEDRCHDQAICTNLDGSYTCSCVAGFSGNGFNCQNINECSLEIDNCDEDSACDDVIGSFRCSCNPGYTGNGSYCRDINECINETNTCHEKAICQNTEGNYTCSCMTGFSGDGFNCQNINECSLEIDNCDEDSTCDDVIGSFRCSCNPGYTGDGSYCRDIDECIDETNKCDVNAQCINNKGSYTCLCLPGFTGNGQNCTNINECSSATHNCHSSATCIDVSGSFTCQCMDGYYGNGTYCQDINECINETNTCHEKAICQNTEGNYTCSCMTGFSGDGFNCQNINECSLEIDNCDKDSTCDDVIGSFRCSCNPGYTGNGRYCRDMNECANKANNCDVNAQCINNKGSYTCLCLPGFTGNGQNCTNINECSSATHNCHSSATCIDVPGSFTCQCMDGYYGNGTYCEDIDECEGNLHLCTNPQWPCVNTPGSYTCDCGGVLIFDGKKCVEKPPPDA